MQPGLVDQGGGLQSVPRFFPPHVLPGNAVQFVADQGSQPLQGGLIARAPGFEEPRDRLR
jgi:hypothetical protein